MITTSALASGAEPSLAAHLDSYRRLADIFHYVLAEQDLNPLLERIAAALAELIPHDTLNVYRADESRRSLTTIYARDEFADQVLNSTCLYGQGITGWAVENRDRSSPTPRTWIPLSRTRASTSTETRS